MVTDLADRGRRCALDSIKAAQYSARCTALLRTLGVMSTRTCLCGVRWQDDAVWIT